MSSRLSPRVSILVISMVAALAAGCGSKSDSKAPGAAKPGDAKSAAGGGDKPKGLPVKAQPVTVGEVQSDLAAVEVRFRDLDDGEIERYLRAEQPYDCAGSAKCETLGIALLDAIDSDDPTALVGLPLIRTSLMLRAAGIALLGAKP